MCCVLCAGPGSCVPRVDLSSHGLRHWGTSIIPAKWKLPQVNDHFMGGMVALLNLTGASTGLEAFKAEGVLRTYYIQVTNLMLCPRLIPQPLIWDQHDCPHI